MTNPSRWQSGFRPVRGRKYTGKYSKNLMANGLIRSWQLKLFKFDQSESAANMEVEGESDEFNESGDSVILWIGIYRSVSRMNLTACTEEELKKFKEFINYAIDMALPIVIDRDRVAKEAADAGQDIFERRHRQPPRLSYLKGAEPKHTESVPNRHSNVLSGDADPGTGSS